MSFIRKRKLPFVNIVMLLLSFINSSLQQELYRYKKHFPKFNLCVSKVAFSKARRKIKPEAFKELFLLTSKLWLKCKSFKLYKGYRVFAIDGSVLQLEYNNTELLGHYGSLGKNKKATRARASILCDVLTGVIVHSELAGISKGERSMALQHIEFFDQYASKNDIIILDRGYPSRDLIAEFDDKRWKYLTRVSKGFKSICDASGENDFIQVICCGKQNCFVRVIKIVLPDGEIEQLISNIPPEDLKHEDFKELYFLRPLKQNTIHLKTSLNWKLFLVKLLLVLNKIFIQACSWLIL